MKAFLFLAPLALGSMTVASEKVSSNPNGQIAAIVIAVNQAEVNAAQSAEQKAKSPAVKEFAKHMIQEHSENTQQQLELTKKLGVEPEDSPKVANLRTDSERQLGEVNTHSGASFDKAYIENQITMHAMVLTSIDRELLPMAQDAQMKSFLETTKLHVKQHLAMAKKIQSGLK